MEATTTATVTTGTAAIAPAMATSAGLVELVESAALVEWEVSEVLVVSAELAESVASEAWVASVELVVSAALVALAESAELGGPVVWAVSAEPAARGHRSCRRTTSTTTLATETVSHRGTSSAAPA